jgi:hypothetical protein
MKSRISDLFFQAATRRNISLRAIARIGNCSPISIERLKSGETRKLDIELVYKVACTLPDPDGFLQEVLPGFSPGKPSSELLDIRTKISEIKHLIDTKVATTASFRPVWCLDDGTCIPVTDSFAASARRIAGIPEGDGGNVIDYVCRGFGWVAVGEQDGFGLLTFDRTHVDARACMKAIGVLDGLPYDRVRVRAGDEHPTLEWKSDARRILERRVRASQRTPNDWIDIEVPISDADERLRGVLETRFYDNPLGNLVSMLSTGESSLFAVKSGEAFCYHIGSKFNAPTQAEIGMRVLDRSHHIQYSAMIDRHIVKAASAERPTVSRIGVDFGFRKTLYERLALPFRLDGRHFVLTTSKILEDSVSQNFN